MKAEIIAVGTELLLGDVINSNAAWLSKELAQLGIDVFHHQTVGDNPARIHALLDHSLNRPAPDRPEALIFTGGLGPTQDDLTVETLAQYFKTPMVLDAASEEKIRSYFIARDMPMSKTNIKQALRPEDAQVLLNPVGTAPGLLWDVSTKAGQPTYCLCFPGVPKELYAMWPQARDFLLQKMHDAGETPTVLATKFLHFFGIGESMLAEKLADLMQQSTPTVAPYVGRAEVKIRLAAKAPTQAQAEAMLHPVQEEILARCGAYYFGQSGTSGETATLEGCVASLLKAKQLTVAVAESCTGGLVSSRLTDLPGSSAYTRLNVVTYSNDQKARLLGVSSDTLAQFGAVSREVAAQMAVGVQKLAGSDYGLSLTGIAGPDGGSDEKPVGLVYIGLVGPEGTPPLTQKILVNPRYSRVDIKYWFSQYALHSLRQALTGTLVPDEEAAIPA